MHVRLPEHIDQFENFRLILAESDKEGEVGGKSDFIGFEAYSTHPLMGKYSFGIRPFPGLLLLN